MGIIPSHKAVRRFQSRASGFQQTQYLQSGKGFTAERKVHGSYHLPDQSEQEFIARHKTLRDEQILQPDQKSIYLK
jgi:hypothetical protein